MKLLFNLTVTIILIAVIADKFPPKYPKHFIITWASWIVYLIGGLLGLWIIWV